jgi:hypothetical protein
MSPEEIKQLAISSSKAYYDYLAKSGKGLNEVEVWGIAVENLAQRVVSLRLSKKIFDTETVVFRFMDDGKEYNTEKIQVLEYDTDRNTLYIEPNAELFPRFNHLHGSQLRVIADMKFLVERVRSWYDQRGDNLQLPNKISTLEQKSITLESFGALQPSRDQLNAIRTIITKPFSYIWGAPGTGKTQLVLANVVIQYVRQGKRCLILAPTNTALEQVMKGVMQMSDAAGIPREKFLRLGHTSKWFAQQYPEVCESMGIQSQRSQIERQIRVVKSVMKKENAVSDDVIPKLENTVEKLKQLKELIEVAGEKNASKKLARQLLKEVKEGLGATPQTDVFIKTLGPDTFDTILSFLDKFIIQQKRDEAVMQARAIEIALTPEAELKSMLRELEELRNKMTGSNEQARRASVVAATLDCYINRFMSDEEELVVDHIFLDEAGYACCAKALVLMKGNAPVTFLGDHLQLPPVCEMNDYEFQTEEQKDVFLWSKSAIHLARLFEDTKEEAYNSYINNEETLSRSLSRTDLRYTHRFGDNLANVLNEYVYQNGFASDSGKGETDIYFVDTNTPVPQPRNENDKPTRESEAEARAIKQFIETTGLTDYAILTPYINQVKLLGKQLPHDRNQGRILTVHGAQGKEWDNVILSVVDTDKKWFTDSKYARTRGLFLLNTAVSRAKKRLIIFCNVPHWKRQNGQLIKGLLDVAQEWPMI